MLPHGPHPLPDGTSVRLRLPHAADRTALHSLLGDHGLAADDIEVRRALRWSPRERVVVCATRWDGGGERLCGFGAVDKDGALTLVAPPGVAAVVREALEAHARAWNRRVA